MVGLITCTFMKELSWSWEDVLPIYMGQTGPMRRMGRGGFVSRRLKGLSNCRVPTTYLTYLTYLLAYPRP